MFTPNVTGWIFSFVISPHDEDFEHNNTGKTIIFVKDLWFLYFTRQNRDHFDSVIGLTTFLIAFSPVRKYENVIGSSFLLCKDKILSYLILIIVVQ